VGERVCAFWSWGKVKCVHRFIRPL